MSQFVRYTSWVEQFPTLLRRTFSASREVMDGSSTSTPAAEAHDVGTPSAHWLELEDPFELLASAIGPPFEPPESCWRLRPVAWQECSTNGPWVHSCLWSARPDGSGSTCVHHFRSHNHDHTTTLCAAIAALVQDDVGRGRDCTASNINGYHGQRDLWNQTAFAATELPTMMRRALIQAASVEASACGREPFALADPPEAWWNALLSSGWNVLHTHPGCRYACTFFVQGHRGDAPEDGTASDWSRLGGRLVLLPSAPDGLAESHKQHLMDSHGSCSAPAADDGGASGVLSSGSTQQDAADAASAALSYLLVDPVPGDLIVWPAFMPHFVIPTSIPAATAVDVPHKNGQQAHDPGLVRRISIACNF